MPGKSGLRPADIIPNVLAVGAVLLAWQIGIQPFMQRAPVELAIRIAPGSPLVLRRSAEAELAAERDDNAAALSRDALGRSPFDVRALRVLGLTEARAGRAGQADELLTLAGNWSLRDDPTHAWLVEHRLRSGDYASAFAHADTLVRRREDIQPPVFKLFTTAAAADPQRVLPVLASLLAAQPPWRPAYLLSLHETPEGLQTAASLAVMLQASRAPLSTLELQQFYLGLLDKGQIAAVAEVRTRIGRPAAGAPVVNGEFDNPTSPEPFQWSYVQKAGAVAEVMTDDVDPSNVALRVEYDGYSAASFARQRLFLTPGRYQLLATSRLESGDAANRMEWAVTCNPTGRALLTAPATTSGPARENWTSFNAEFSVPADCAGQWLEIRGLPLDSRSPMVVWFDRVQVKRIATSSD